MRKLLLLSLLCLPLATYGTESIELQDGTKIEGKILSVTSGSVRIEVQTSPTVRGEKSYPRADVAKIQHAGQDDIAFDEIAPISAPDTADDPAVYDALLEPVQTFMKNYAYSKHMPQARQLAATLESERARLAAGEVKVDGEWISQDVSPADRTEVGGRVQWSKMKTADDPAAALAAFEVLEKSHNTSSSYPEAVKAALSSIEKLRANIARARTDLERRTREQEQGLPLASADRRLQIEAGIAQEKAALQAQIDRVRRSGGKWLPVLADAKVLEDLSKLADTEEARLSRIDVAKMSDAVETARTAREQLDTGDLEGAKTSLDEAQKLWSQHVLLASLRDSLKKAQDEAARRAKEEEQSAQP
ncbi:MAG: hypothetical protein WEC73_02895 [Chthoniobacterales bacterium]